MDGKRGWGERRFWVGILWFRWEEWRVLWGISYWNIWNWVIFELAFIRIVC